MVPSGAFLNLDACSERAKEGVAEVGVQQHRRKRVVEGGKVPGRHHSRQQTH
jgi:hypothetical protein